QFWVVCGDAVEAPVERFFPFESAQRLSSGESEFLVFASSDPGQHRPGASVAQPAQLDDGREVGRLRQPLQPIGWFVHHEDAVEFLRAQSRLLAQVADPLRGGPRLPRPKIGPATDGRRHGPTKTGLLGGSVGYLMNR